MSFPSSLLSSCHHSNPSPTYVAVYCIALSSAFVGGLYVVPKDIRRLSREDERQIKLRMVLVFLTCLVASLLYPTLFCGSDDGGRVVNGTTNALRYLGSSWDTRRDLAVLLHVMTLYLGPIKASLGKDAFCRCLLLHTQKAIDWIHSSISRNCNQTYHVVLSRS